RSLLSAGRAWAAYQSLAPALRDSARRTPAVVLTAAQAAAAWGGWAHVDELLGTAPWADTAEGGAAQQLLARAALASSRDSAAVRHAAAALQRAAPGVQRGERMLLYARALDRLNDRDSAREAYLAAAAALPAAADWLRLRAASLTADSAERQTLYRDVAAPAARAYRSRTEAGALERAEDFAGAASAFAALGSSADALRARALHALRTAAPRDSLRAALLDVARTRAGHDEARAATELLDQWFAPHPAPDELLIARALSRSGPLGRAAQGYARAAAAGLLTNDDRFSYGRTLARLNRDRAAAAEYARVTGSGELAAAAAYQRGRALVALGEVANARIVLRRVVADFPRDTSAGLALYLLADLATDEQRDAAARDAYREGARQFPALSRTARARFLAALIAYVAGEHATAGREWDALAADDPNGSETLAARYWSGRAWERAGDRAKARQLWRRIPEEEPTSFYAFAAARRLGDQDWSPFADAAAPAAEPPRHAVLTRALRLEELDLDHEARLEFAHFERLARGTDSLTVGEAARQLVAAGRAFRAIPLAAAAVPRATGAARVETYRALYPAPLLTVILSESRRNDLDPALFAALIRQESWYNPRATSGAGARGYAQVMPSVGLAVARSLDFPHWDSALLYEPEASVILGARHLAGSLRRYRDEPRSLAAYNAGQSRVQRWDRKLGTEDVEVFIERIPFVETRDYVRIVLRNRELYRALYPALRPA
ncbi:MAG TPA: lytic transglycosylase domain-containing protein, partial [Gemmatimonadaceae bacterium]|nr:lytic transglycosylase domain-containing protein [Gemmatimonadaceae bacterium]